MAARRVLVVEDDPAIRRGIVDALRFDGYEVLEAGARMEGQRLAERVPCDLLLLDLVLPDGDGLDLLRAVRKGRPTLPVIILTARGQEEDRVNGLKLGADDYVVKPFSVRELMLRVRAVLRRSDVDDATATQLAAGDIQLDTSRHQVRVKGEEIILTALEFRLLHTLMERSGRVQTREVLLSDVWGIQAEIHTRTVDTHIKRLREKLGPAGDIIETVRGVGYKLTPP